MQGRDRRLQDVRPAPAERQGALEPRSSRSDLLGVPERPVLIGEEDDAAVGEACLAAGVVHQHQRQQPVHLRLVGHQLCERVPEPDRLGGEVDAAAVALVEDQVDDGEDRGQALGEQMIRRDAEGDAGGLDLPLRPQQPLRHRLVGHEERAGDLLGLQPAQRSQRQRHLRLELERGVAAREEELQPLVRDRRLVHGLLRRLGHVEQARLRRERAVAADAVDRAVAGGGHEPRTRIGGRPVAGPALGRDRERLLSGVLGEVEVAEEADQACEHAAPLVAEDLLEDR